MRRNTLVLMGSQFGSLTLRFTKNLILARLLTQADYGVTVALMAVAVSATLITDMGIDKLLISNREVDDRKLQTVVTSLQLARVLLSSAILLFAAQPLATVLHVPHAVLAFRLVAISMGLTGFYNLDMKRYQRHHRFIPDSIVQLSQDSCDFCVAVAVAYMFRTYYAASLSAIAGMAAGIIVSNLLAERRYRLSWDKEIVRRTLVYSVPLMLNGLIILLSTQADRIVVGTAAGLKELAIYGATMTIISTPGLLAAKITVAVPLPALAEVIHDERVFRRRFQMLGVVMICACVCVFLPLTLLGGSIISLVFGARYRPPGDLAGLIAIGQAAALMRAWPNVGALALARTKNLVIASAPRMLGIALAFIAVHYHAGLSGIATCFACGEVAGLVGGVWHLTHARPGILIGLRRVAAAAAVAFVAAHLSNLVLEHIAQRILATVILVLLFGLLAALISPEARFIMESSRQQVRAVFRRALSWQV